MAETENLDMIFEEYETIFLEPKTVSGWLGLPGSQLPRETGKIIGQPAQPARKKGSSARYSFKDAILMKLGRTHMNLGITPHRVRSCVEKVRQDFHTLITGWWGVPVEYTYDEHEITLYLIGRETSGGFEAQLIPEQNLTEFITEKGLEHVEWREAVRGAMLKRAETREAKREPHKLDLSKLRAGSTEGMTRESLEKGPAVKPYPYVEPNLDELAEEGYEYIERTDPGSPAIVQNVTRFVQDQSLELYRYIKKMAGQKRT